MTNDTHRHWLETLLCHLEGVESFIEDSDKYLCFQIKQPKVEAIYILKSVSVHQLSYSKLLSWHHQSRSMSMSLLNVWLRDWPGSLLEPLFALSIAFLSMRTLITRSYSIWPLNMAYPAVKASHTDTAQLYLDSTTRHVSSIDRVHYRLVEMLC